jgi:hypothetical protein
MVRFPALGLAAAISVASPALAESPPPPLDPSSIDSRNRCEAWDGRVRYILEDSPAVRTTPGVSRRGGVLRVHGEVFRDIRAEQEMDTEHYYYAGALTVVPVDAVIHAPYEGQQVILVHRTAHDQVEMPGFPVASPDGHLLAAMGNDPVFGQWGVRIVEWTPQGFTPVARFPTISHPCELRWTGERRLELRTQGVGSDGFTETWRPAVIERRNGRWVLIGPDDGQVTNAE